LGIALWLLAAGCGGGDLADSGTGVDADLRQRCGFPVCSAYQTCASCPQECGACASDMGEPADATYAADGAGSSHSVTLSWGASPTAGVAYNLYRATVSGGPYAKLASGVTATSATDALVSAATTYYYVVTATNAGGESARSNEIAAVIP
jgi:hypothetical protein